MHMCLCSIMCTGVSISGGHIKLGGISRKQIYSKMAFTQCSVLGIKLRSFIRATSNLNSSAFSPMPSTAFLNRYQATFYRYCGRILVSFLIGVLNCYGYSQKCYFVSLEAHYKVKSMGDGLHRQIEKWHSYYL